MLPGDGCEYGTEWVIESLLKQNLKPVDVESAFEDSIRGCYPETTKVGWMDLDTVSVMKDFDPVSWRCAQSDWESAEASDGIFITFDGGCTYYWRDDVESFILEVA